MFSERKVTWILLLPISYLFSGWLLCFRDGFGVLEDRFVNQFLIPEESFGPADLAPKRLFRRLRSTLEGCGKHTVKTPRSAKVFPLVDAAQ